MNAGYKTDGSPRELLLFGSNGAGEAFGFDTRNAPAPIVVVPFVGLDWSDAIVIATSLREFLDIRRTVTPNTLVAGPVGWGGPAGSRTSG
jgi:hypothetical protein